MHKLSPRLDLSTDREGSTEVVRGGSPDVGNWHTRDGWSDLPYGRLSGARLSPLGEADNLGP